MIEERLHPIASGMRQRGLMEGTRYCILRDGDRTPCLGTITFS